MKWEKIRDCKGVDYGTENCPLCRMFYKEENMNPCAGCPINIYTSATLCEGTPYIRWLSSHGIIYFPIEAETRAQVHIADKMVKFLQKVEKHFTWGEVIETKWGGING